MNTKPNAIPHGKHARLCHCQAAHTSQNVHPTHPIRLLKNQPERVCRKSEITRGGAEEEDDTNEQLALFSQRSLGLCV